MKIEFYDWVERPALIIEGTFPFAVWDSTSGWRPLSFDHGIDILKNGVDSTEEALREIYGDLPPLPKASDHHDFDPLVWKDDPAWKE
jgi:hypothetical protein